MLVSSQMLVNMAPIIQCSVSGVSLAPGPSFTTGKNSRLRKGSYLGMCSRQTSSSSKFLLPLPTTSMRLFLPCKTRYVFYRETTRTHISSALGAEVANEEADTQAGDGILESPTTVETSEESPEKPKEKAGPVPVKRTRATWKSEMPPVKNEELVPGATFTGKVKAIQPFGAFVDIGAFTDGLVHVSRLSDSFVKDVGRFVSVGQEVKVKLVEANFETGRISLSMRELNDSNKTQQRQVAPQNSGKAQTDKNFTPKAYEKKDDVKKVSKFVVGQELRGTVKNLTRAGAFISLPGEEEGFLPRSEESDMIFVNPMGGSSMRVGEEVNVRVLRSFKGHVTLTMKSDDSYDLNSNQGVVHTATNPFVLAFQKNKALAAYLDERKKMVEPTEIKQIQKASDETDEMVEKNTTGRAILEVDDQLASGSKSLADEISLQEVGGETNIIDKGSNESVESDEDPNGVIPKLSESVDGVQIKEEQVEVSIENLAPEGTISSDKIEKNTIGRSILEVDDQLEGGSESLAEEISLQEVGGETNISDKGLNESVKSDEDSHGVVSSLSESVDGVQITEEQVEASIENLAPEGTISNSKAEKNTIAHAMVEVDNQLAGGSESLAYEISLQEVDRDTSISILDKGSNESVKSDEDSDGVFSKLSESVEGVQILEEQVEVSIKNMAPGQTILNDSVDKNTIGQAILEADDQLAGGSGSLPDQILLQGVGGTTKILDKCSNANVKSDDSNGVISKLTESMDEVQLTEEQVEVSIENLESGGTMSNDKVEKNTIGHAMPQADNQLAGGSESLVDEILLQDVDRETNTLDIGSNERVKIDEDSDGIISKLAQSKDGVQIIEEQVEVSIESLVAEGTVSNENQIPSNASERPGVESSVANSLSGSTADGVLTKDKLHIETAGKEASVAMVIGDGEKTISERNANIGTLNEQIVFSTGKESQISGEAVPQVDESIEKLEVQVQTTTEVNMIPTNASFEDENVGSEPEENSTSVISEGQTNVLSFKGSFMKAISPALVKQLRDETGAGMMDCKKALSETGGDTAKAQEYLRKKGLASADKKASRVTADGRIGSYIHDSRIGVLIEVNCETDFVSRGEIFKELVDDLAMQVAASPQVQYLATDEVPEDLVNKEREIELQKEDLLSKPEQIRSKIVEGRIRKRLEELALLEQPFIKNDKVVVKDWVKQAIAAIGENIKVNRFVRYNLGEGLEKKTQDFASEVAAQTAAKPMDSPALEKPITDAAREFVQKSAMVISAALVKRLREETGAGMMDCKKALSETGGDLEKAQAYLRKKGLSSADKKSSRLAAEGRIGSYIHDSRIGALIEVNSETDFVGRSEKFRELVNDLAMQVVACPQVEFVSIDEIPDSIVKKEKELELQREDLLSRPEHIRGRIVDGRVSKRLGELALLEQAFIKNDSILVKDLVKQTIAALGENIKVRRFIRFTLGEATEGERTTSQASGTSAGFDSTIK